MHRIACSLVVLVACGSSDKAETPAPKPVAEAPKPAGPEISGQIEVFSPGTPNHHQKIGFAISAPAGTTSYESGFTLPDKTVVYVVPSEAYVDPQFTYPNHERPRSERAFVSADCAQRQGMVFLEPWSGKVALKDPPAGFTLCEGAGFGASETSCYYADGHVAAQRVDCGSGRQCLTRDQAMTVLAACTTLRRTGT